MKDVNMETPELDRLMKFYETYGSNHYEQMLAEFRSIKERLESQQKKIELLEACRDYDASGKNRPDGYIVPRHFTGQRIDEMNSHPEQLKEKTKEQELVTVCDSCFTASCWQGIFMCEDAQNSGTVERTIEELEKLNLESPHYWKNTLKQ